jgi:hypothetical protein
VEVFGIAHVLTLGGTCAGALLAPLLLHLGGVKTAVVVAGLTATVLQAFLLRGLVALDHKVDAGPAALEPAVDLLRRLILFHDANRSMLYRVADQVVPIDIGDGVEIVSEGEPAEHLFVLLDGQVEVTGRAGDTVAVLRRLEAPSYFGEIGLLHGIARTASVTAVGPCRLWRIPGPDFLAVASSAGVSGALTETVRVRIATSWTADRVDGP